jgi:hypothetical protein
MRRRRRIVQKDLLRMIINRNKRNWVGSLPKGKERAAMLEIIYECEQAYGWPGGAIPEGQARAVFGDVSVDGALAAGYLRRVLPCRRGNERLIALSDSGRARVDAGTRRAVLARMDESDATLAALFGGRP